MDVILLIAYVMLFASTVTESLAIGWLLLISAALGGYCLVVICTEGEELTNVGEFVFVFSVIGFIYSIMTIYGFDVISLF